MQVRERSNGAGHNAIPPMPSELAAAPDDRHSPTFAALGLVVVGLLIAVTTAALLVNLRQEAITEVGNELIRHATVLADGTERALETVELGQNSLIDQVKRAGTRTPEDFRRFMSGPEAHQELVGLTRNLPQLASTATFDTKGMLINHSRGGTVPALNAADQDFFKALLTDPTRDRIIGGPMRGRISGEWVITMTARVRGTDGTFLGAIVSVLDVKYFNKVYQTLLAGPDSTVVMFRSDGMLLVHAPPLDQAIGRVYGTSPNFQRFMHSGDNSVLFRQIGKLHGDERLVASHKLVNQPLVVDVTTTVREALGKWRVQATYLIGAVAVIELVVLWIGLLMFREVRVQRQLGEARATQALAEQRRLEAAREMETLIVTMPGVVVKLRREADQTWRKIYVAPSIAELTGFTAEEAMAPRWLRGQVEPAQIELLLRRQNETQASGRASAEIDFRHRNGSLRRLHAQMRAQATPEGTTDVIIIWTDVTQERALSAQLAQATKMATLGELATGMAHELNQPLAAITLAAENAMNALPRVPTTRQRVKDKLELITALAARAGSILDHMRVFGRSGTGPSVKVELGSVLQSASSLLRRKLTDSGVRLRGTLPEDLPPLLAKEVPLEQVLLNLISNSCDAYIARGATVSPEQRVVTVGAEAVDGTIRITVQDHAGGIDAHLLSRIFEPFFTTKPAGQGTGLGLSISCGIITDMGGTITAENEDGGMIFRITLPAAQEGVR
jgi:C4-dicarboxylate-specific signal transduction histidine kinase